MKRGIVYSLTAKKITVMFLILLLCLATLAGCNNNANKASNSPEATDSINETIDDTYESPDSAAKEPKYIFLFIGDGMGFSQASALGIYNGTTEHDFVGTADEPTVDNIPQAENPSFMDFPTVGAVTTYDASKFVTDSASAATAIASGVKTLDGAIGVDALGESVPSIAELLKENKDYKIGIITNVSLNHATPAGFYAHVNSRGDLVTIGEHLAESDFDFFGGGGIYIKDEADHAGVMEKISQAGYNVVNTKEEIMALSPDSGKTVAINEILDSSADITFSVDQEEGDLKLVDFVKKGIEVIDNDTGFFMMVESGKIDWAAHCNDAYTVINEVKELETAVEAAIEFYNQHPDETLILVTGDHETGGMALGQNTTFYDTYYTALDEQQISHNVYNDYIEKYRENNTSFEDVMTEAKELFGLVMPDDKESENATLLLTKDDVATLKAAYTQSMIPPDDRDQTKEYANLYSTYGYEPLQLMITRIINSKVGIGWTSTAHSGIPVAIYSMGTGQEMFGTMIDNTDICNNLKILTGIE